jgi:hypothetical protein
MRRLCASKAASGMQTGTFVIDFASARREVEALLAELKLIEGRRTRRVRSSRQPLMWD